MVVGEKRKKSGFKKIFFNQESPTTACSGQSGSSSSNQVLAEPFWCLKSENPEMQGKRALPSRLCPLHPSPTAPRHPTASRVHVHGRQAPTDTSRSPGRRFLTRPQRILPPRWQPAFRPTPGLPAPSSLLVAGSDARGRAASAPRRPARPRLARGVRRPGGPAHGDCG